MEAVRFGSTGLKVSRLCLGTMTFGLQCDQKTSLRILDRAAEGGITFIDTADAYPLGGTLETAGRSEEIVGKWLQGRRGDFIVATKCHGRMGANPWNAGLSRKHILEAMDASLARLQTDYVDLLQLHHPDPDTPMDESLSAMDDLVRAGKVRYIGVSNHPAWRIARAIGRSELLGLARFVSVQPRYSLLFRQMERDMLPMCAEEGLAVIPYNPLAGGLLTGKHKYDASPPEGTRFQLGTAAGNYQDRYWQQREFTSVEALREIAAAAGLGMVQMALAWVLANPVVTAPIIGASKPAQLDDSIAALSVTLTDEVRQRLDEATAGYRLGDAPR
ncbi:MAG: aldo/keto reductase [Gammaproteobacteria bacterium]|nr:MAG: aldo/keto reductase [Gammaproteobacteria bacterium]